MSNQISEQFDLEQPQLGSFVIRFRYIQVALIFFLLVVHFNIRICLSVAIVAMTNNGTSSNPDIPYYDWGNSSIILSSFFWSYAALQFFAGNLSHFFGNKKLLFVATIMNGLSCLLVPVAAEHLGANGVMALRIIQGLFQGFLLPCMNGVLGRWLPPKELSFLNSIVFSGVFVGIIGSQVITGYISASSWGWPAAFYLFGSMAFVWCIFWGIFGAETPATHSSITMEERKYIENSLGQENDHLIDKKSIPWMAILKCLPYWAIIVAAIGESWTTTLINSELPSYLSYAVGLNIKDSSLFSAFPTAAALIASLCYGPIAGLTIKKGWVSTVNSRRIFHGYGMFLSTIGLLFLSYFNGKITIAALLIFSQAAGAAVTCGYLVNLIDLSPRYSAILSGFSNGIGQLIAILAPILVHFMVSDVTDRSQWRYTFILAGILGISTAVFFIVFCSGDRQWWDDVDKKKMETVSESSLPAYAETNLGFQSDIVK